MEARVNRQRAKGLVEVMIVPSARQRALSSRA